MQTKELISDIIISGAGPAGLTLSALLGQAGFDIILIDAEPPTLIDTSRPSGRTAALLDGSINVLKATGVWGSLKDHATPLKIMRIVDAKRNEPDCPRVEFKATDIGRNEFGHNIPNAFLKEALLNRIKNIKSIRHFAPSRLSDYSIEGQKVIARTEDGKIIRAQVIIGTDGRGSIVRAISGIDAKKHDYTQMAMTCLIEHTKPHNFTSTEFHRSGGPFTFVPMPGNRSSVVWVEKTDDAKKFLAMKKNEYEQAIQDRSQGLLGIVTLKSPPESWPLMMLNSRALVGNRSALAAEAAHVLSPIGAQGLNLSLRDVAALAETLTDAARLGEDIGCGQVLSRYEKRRHMDIKSHVIGIDGYNRAVANDMAALNDLRRLSFRSVEKIPPLKYFLMYQGLAPSMDEGRLLSGSAL